MKLVAVGAFGALLALSVSACGETRSALGDECLRSDDCLSDVCSARTCVAAPPLVTGAGDAPPAETVDIPAGDAAVFPDAADASDAG